MLIGTAGLLSWGFVDATDGDDKHAILDTFSSWFGRGNDREAESLKAIESYDAIEKNEGSGTWLPTYSPTEMPTAGSAEDVDGDEADDGTEEEAVVDVTDEEVVVIDAEESDIKTNVAGSSSGDEGEIEIEIDAKAAKSPTHSPTQLVEEETEEISYNDTTGEVSSFPFLHKPNGRL